MLIEVWQRYRRPLMISETASPMSHICASGSASAAAAISTPEKAADHRAQPDHYSSRYCELVIHPRQKLQKHKIVPYLGAGAVGTSKTERSPAWPRPTR